MLKRHVLVVCCRFGWALAVAACLASCNTLVTVTSEPSGAHVFIDSVHRGKTPIKTDVSWPVARESRKNQIELYAQGYRPLRRKLHRSFFGAPKPEQHFVLAEKKTSGDAREEDKGTRPDDVRESSVMAQGEPTAAGTGAIYIVSDPPGASVFLDEEVSPRAKTPYLLQEVSEGRHTVRLGLKGYTDSIAEVAVVAGDIHELEPSLHRARRPVEGILRLRIPWFGRGGGDVGDVALWQYAMFAVLPSGIGGVAGVRVGERHVFALGYETIGDATYPRYLNQFSLRAETYWPLPSETKETELGLAVIFIPYATLLHSHGSDPEWPEDDFDAGDGWKGGVGVGLEVAYCYNYTYSAWRAGLHFEHITFTERIELGSSSACRDSMSLRYLFVSGELRF